MNLNFNDVKADVATYNNLAVNLKERVRTIIKDKTLPLDDRWNLMTESPFLGDTDSADGDVEMVGNYTLYDDFFIDKYQTAEYNELYERMINMKAPKEKIDKWREFILDNGFYSFTCDW